MLEAEVSHFSIQLTRVLILLIDLKFVLHSLCK